jgi:hypothetical protein
MALNRDTNGAIGAARKRALPLHNCRRFLLIVPRPFFSHAHWSQAAKMRRHPTTDTREYSGQSKGNRTGEADLKVSIFVNVCCKLVPLIVVCARHAGFL